MYYIHKYEVAQQYGGPEEGGWWFDTGIPVESAMFRFEDEEEAYECCRNLNQQEYERREREEKYGYTSVLSAESTHYSYDVSDFPMAEIYPKERPHYE